MSNIYRNDDLASKVGIAALSSRLTVRFKKYGDNNVRKYEYSFDDNELLVSPTSNTIEFSVKISDAPTEIDKFRFFDYCSTHPLKVKDPNGFETATPIEQLRIPNIAKPVRLTAVPDNKELVLIGLIVEIRYKGETKSDYVLCDPQVGNGPPSGGGAHYTPACTFSAV